MRTEIGAAYRTSIEGFASAARHSAGLPAHSLFPQTRIRELIAAAAADPELRGPMAIGAPTPEFLHENGMAVGTPEECLATMKTFRDIGLDQLVTTPGAGWHDPHEMVLESIRLCGEKIIPELR